jgi:glycosyltransferase involved in cell wall biosynthesis
MRILHIIPSISKKRGGPSTAIISMVKALRHEGVDATILTTCDNIEYREFEYPLRQWFCINDVPILIFPILESKLRLINEYLISPSLSLWLYQHIDAYDAVHIHAIFSFSSTVSMLIARQKKIPYIVRTIGQLNAWSLSQSRIKKLLMLSLIEKNNLRNALAVHVTSRSEMNDVKKVYNHKNVLCLELGVDFENLPLPKQRIASKEICFIFLSRIHPKKQLEKLLEAFSILSTEYIQPPRWRLFIAGTGEENYVNSLRKFAKKTGISDSIEWLGHLDGERKLRLLRKCDWYVLPSISENFGLSVVEALANGVPVIVSDGVGISDIILEKKAGFVIGASFSLKDALKVAMQGAPIEMKIAALDLARNRFSWKELGKKLADFYNVQITIRTKK